MTHCTLFDFQAILSRNMYLYISAYECSKIRKIVTTDYHPASHTPLVSMLIAGTKRYRCVIRELPNLRAWLRSSKHDIKRQMYHCAYDITCHGVVNKKCPEVQNEVEQMYSNAVRFTAILNSDILGDFWLAHYFKRLRTTNDTPFFLYHGWMRRATSEDARQSHCVVTNRLRIWAQELS